MIDNRPFHYALVASLGLHALLLFAFPDLIDTARRAVSLPPQIIARLMEPEPAPAPAPAVPPEKPAAAPKVAKPVPPVTKPVPEIRTPTVRETRPELPAPVVEAPAAAAQAPAPAETAAIQPQPAPPAPQPAPESLSRDQYRVQLIDEARRHKRYPPLARENNWQGEVLVAVAIGASGRPSVTLKASSGYEVLDRQALQMFGQAARSVPVPPALRGRQFALEVRAIYGLED